MIKLNTERNGFMKNKKKISIAAACVLLLTTAAGCGGTKSTSKSADGGNVTITVGNWPDDSETDKVAEYQGYVDKLHQKYPNITIKPDHYVYSKDTFIPNAASGQLPTVYNVPFTEPSKIIASHYAADITDSMKKYNYDTNINKECLKIVTSDGKYYGVPYTAYGMGLWYNMNVMKEAGYVNEDGTPKTPGTYEELGEMAKAIKEKTGKAGFFMPTTNNMGGWEFMNIAWSYGVKFETEENGKWKATFNTDEAVKAMQFIKDLKWKYNALPDNNLVNMDDFYKFFGTDQTAMGFFQEGIKNSPIENYHLSKDSMAVSAVPAGPSGRYAQMGGMVWMLATSSSAEQIDAAFKWFDASGIGATVDDSTKAVKEKAIKADADKNDVVVKPSFDIWTGGERATAFDEIYKKYTNVNANLWPDITKDVTYKQEEPQSCQQLYQSLDSVIQAVLTDQNADPKALLEKANSNFQKDFLDNAQ